MIHVELVNAFSMEAQGGNPAGVVLDAGTLTEEEMQAVAAQVGYSETAFVQPSENADFKLRFFTPNTEVDLCGHATIATFATMLERGLVVPGSLRQETKAGCLRLELNEDGSVVMEQARPEFFEKPDSEEILRSLGLSLDAGHDEMPMQIVSTGLRDIIVPLKSRAHLAGIKADFARIKEISKKHDVSGYHVFALDVPEPYSAVCRNFAPLCDIPEESATGTASGALAAYLWLHGRDKVEKLKFLQGVEMGTPSVIDVSIIADEAEILEVWVGGQARITGSMDI